jgi:hypothetical protein
MTKNNFYSASLRLRAIATVLVTLTLVTFPAPSDQAVNAQTPAQKTPSPERESNGGQKEGIKVHGHWTIEVRNPDGTLAKRQEFENSLISDGAKQLLRVLARQQTVGEWSIIFQGHFDTDRTCLSGGSPVACQLVEVNSQTQALPWIFKTLVASWSQSDPLKFVLSGSATAAKAGNVFTVFTRMVTCNPDVLPANCSSNAQFLTNFTFRELPQAIDVAAGQIIQITVAISFS